MSTRKEQREKRRLAILEIALDLFISKGYAGTRIGDIAEKANMSAGLMFHYFESKAALYEELIRIGVSGPVRVMALDSSDPLRFFETVASHILAMLLDNSFVTKIFVFMEQASFHPPISDTVKELLNEMNGVLKQSISIIEKGQERGQIRPGNPEALSILYWQIISGIALYTAAFPDAPLPEVEWIIDCLRSRES